MKAKATTSAGNSISVKLREKLTKKGRLFIEFSKTPKSKKDLKIEVEIKTGKANKFILDLGILDIEASFPNKKHGEID